MNSLNKQSSNSNKSSQLNVDENLYGAVADLSENATSPQKGGASTSGAVLSSKMAARLRQEVHGRLDEQQQNQIHNSDSKRKQQMMRHQLTEYYDESTIGTEYQKVIVTNYPMATDEEKLKVPYIERFNGNLSV